MFAKSIVLSDAFTDMPATARCLYFTLGMFADDDGFIGNPKSVMRQCGSSEDDMRVLLSKRFILAFESGVIVIKHWRMNNYLQNDRHYRTTYLEELATLELDEKGAYTEKNKEKSMYTKCIQNVYTGKVSIDKDSIVEDSIDNTICATSETEAAPTTTQTPTKYKFKCKPSKKNGQTEYILSQEDLDFYIQTYPNIDIDQELRKMWIWLKNNNLKTYNGMGKFISSWLARTNDRQPSKKSQKVQDMSLPQQAYVFDQQQKYTKAIQEAEEAGLSYAEKVELRAKRNAERRRQKESNDNQLEPVCIGANLPDT